MKTINSKTIIILSMVFSAVFSASAYAYGSINSGTFENPPADDELAEGYAIYQVGDKYVVDESPKIAGVNLVVCSRGSKSYFHKVGRDGTPENYLTFLSPTDKYISFASDDENVATADKTAFNCNNVGRTVIHINTGVYSPDKYKYNLDYDIIVYDVIVNGNGLRRQIAQTIDKAMSVLANGGEMPKFIDEKTAYMLFDIMTTGKDLNANLEVKSLVMNDVSNEHRNKIEKKMDKNDKLISYYDVNIETSEENVDGVGYINELDEDIEVSVDIPSLPELKKGYTRNFYAVRAHDDEAERIDVSIVDGKAVFKTDRFSTYALAYYDSIEAEAPDSGGALKGDKELSLDYDLFIITGVMLATLFVFRFVLRKG